MITKKKKAALVACSDPISQGRLTDINQVADFLQNQGLDVILPDTFFAQFSMNPALKAKSLMDCFRDPEMEYIFDVSGGDLANAVLPYLDYDAIRNSNAVFYGYSDLTTIINAIIAKTGKSAVNYQIRNILYDHADEERQYLQEKILPGDITADDLSYHFLRGEHMQGKILGGNIRCFLKLAGTPYWPDMRGNILLLESMGGGVYQMMTALEQYRQMGVFEQISGVILGTFSKMEKEDLQPPITELILNELPKDIPVACTRYVGHYSDAKAVVLGVDTVLGNSTSMNGRYIRDWSEWQR